MNSRLPFRRRHRGALIAAAALAVVAVTFGAVWFQPQKLWIDDEVDEAAPVPTAQPGLGAAPPADAAASGRGELVVRGEGPFRSLDHTTTGVARVLADPGGPRYLRLEDLETSNGPDLRVYLSAAPATALEGVLDDDFVDLGELKGNVGDQNYEIPAGTDLNLYRTVVIWCRRFGSGFGVAPIG